MARARGTSVRTAERDLRVVKLMEKLTEDEARIVFTEEEGRKPSKGQMHDLCALSDEARTDAITLAASGLRWAEALEEVARRLAQASLAKPGRKPSADELTDDEWVEALCPRMEGLKKRAVFKVDAALYRKYAGIRRKFVKEVQHLLLSVKAAGAVGPAWYVIERACQLKHPNDWLVCSLCEGTGKAPAEPRESDKGKPCPNCHGAAYRVTHEPVR
jgi:hypothetical protein